MADDWVRITRTFDNGETLSSRVLAESLPSWMDNGWELAPDFLEADEVDGEPVAESNITFADWLNAMGGDLPAEETLDEDVPEENPEPVDETAAAESSQSTETPAEEN